MLQMRMRIFSLFCANAYARMDPHGGEIDSTVKYKLHAVLQLSGQLCLAVGNEVSRKV